PYDSDSPDVVYSFTPGASMQITIDLCASGYDTKVIVYENDCAAAAYDCNDDACPGYRSLIEGMAVTGGNTYYIVIDGYGGDYGDYTLHVEEYIFEECIVECPTGATMESEACGDDGNGGCNMVTPAWEPIACGETVCGTIWANTSTRDTDWYEVYVGAPGPITWTVEAEFDVVIGYIAGCPDGAPSCGCAASLDPYTTGSCNDVISVTYTATAAGYYWFFVSSNGWFDLPCGSENDYVATVSCGGGGTGRCCYGDPMAPNCVDGIEYAECVDTYGGTFAGGLNCVDDPCPVETPCADCPPEGVAESEPCGSDMNGGCNMGTPTWEPIACGETICGTVWASGSTRDTDWFELVLTADANITFECEAEFPFVVGYIDGCPMGSPDCGCITALNPYAVGDPCTSQLINMDLTAGTHWLFVSASVYDGYPCGADNDYVATLTCGEPPVGRCCYGDPFSPSCDDVTPSECAGLGGQWDGTKNCVDDPCPIPEGNDECIGAELMTSGMEVNGTTVGATIDCPGVLDWNAVWYYFEDEYACAHATMDYCDVATPLNVECLGVVVYAQCDDCPNYILYTSNEWVDCGTASSQPITHFDYLTGPATYYYPVFMGDGSCNGIEIPFSFRFTLLECPPPEPGDNCDDPLVINLPGDLDYLDAGQTTCGRQNFVSETCLGSYDGGEDIHYVINVASAVDVDVKMDPLGSATWTGMLIDDACPADPSTCLYETTTSGSSPLILNGVHLEPGTYYIMIDTWPSPDCIPTFDLTITAAAGPTPGDDCTGPVEVKIPTDLPYADIANYTCGRGEFADATCLGYYDGGDDIFYEVQVTVATVVTITMDPKGTTYTGIAIDDACPPDLDCIALVTGSSGTTLKVIEDLLLDPGTYYIMIDTWPSPQCIADFDLFIEGGMDPGELTYTPASFDFGTVNAGDNGSGTLTLDNIGEMDLNWDASVVYHAPSAPEIEGAYISAGGDYSPGATMDVVFTLQNASSDAEWLDEATITFPPGVFVNSATNFVVVTNATHYLQWDGTVGDNQTTVWFDHNGGYGNIYSTETAEATINITFDAGLAGPITMPYTISGDDWGGDPHDVSGVLVMNQVDPAAGWLSVSPTSGTIPGTGLAPQDVTVGWDATGLYNETYEADIVISHDGVNKGSAVVPVTMTVTGGDLKAAMGPDPMYIYYQFAYTPYVGSIFVGNFNPGYSAANVASVDINGVAGTFVQTHPSMAGFSGDVAEFSFPVADFLEGLGAPLDLVTVPFSITGTFDDAAAFSGGGHVDVYGKSSISGGKNWIVPQDEVVLHGDVDVSGYLDIDDVTFLISVIFQGGIMPGPMTIGDCDCSHDTDIDDVVYMIAYIFIGGPAPCEY
ncbi:MAG: hypothetical protein KKG33_12655, partial [candidate division Zixibacteria bacterium]|nr:hypothetical protein [candidate division Zixibacteria bacterium]